MKKAGYIAIVGRPNVGKSTLLNAMLGEKIAIVSSKPQTTRNRILGILTRGEAQFVFVDTPGLHKPQNSLGDYMVAAANASIKEADGLVLMVDAGREPTGTEKNVINYLKQSGVPAVLAMNKIDLYGPAEVAACIQKYAALHDFSAFVPLSAKNGKQVDDVLDECEKLLPAGEWFFPEDMITDQPERQMAAEIIREKLLRTLDKEVPHGVAVVIEEFTEQKDLIRIRAEIFCEKATHKGIIVGKNGAELKRVGSYARADLEKLFGTKVFLDLWVKVKENWRDSRAAVGNFGYREEK